MAIAFDSINSGLGSQNTQNASWSVTGPSGSDRLLVVGIETYVNNSDVVTSVTYGGVALTRVSNGYVANPGGSATYYYYLLNPATGANNLDVAISGGINRTIVAVPAFYTGVKQSGQPDAGGLNATASSASSVSRAITTVANNSWPIAFIQNDAGVQSASAGSTARMTGDSRGIYDSGTPISPAASKTLGAQLSSGNGNWTIIIASFQPSTALVVDATVSPLAFEVAIPSVTATGSRVETASVSPVSLELSIPAVDAEGSNTATVSPLALELAIPSVTPTAHINASVSPLLLEVTIPSVTAAMVATATVSPIALSLSIPEVLPSYTLAPIEEPTSAGGFPFALDLFDGADVHETLQSPDINVKGWSKRINAPGKMVFRMNKHHAEATDDNLRLWRNIRLYRRKRDGTADMEAVWYGLILAKREVGEYIEVLCHGALRIFSKRETGAAESFTGEGSAEAFGLLSDANTTGDTGVTEGTDEITETLDLVLDHVEMLRALEQIHSATGGEFEVDDLGAFNSVQALGSDKSETIELIFRRDGQEGNVISYEIAEDGEPMANRIIGTTTGGGGLESTYNHPTSTNDYPVLVERKAFNEAQDQSTLDALTEAYGLQRGLPIPDVISLPATAVKKFNTITGQREISGLQYGDVEVGDLVLVTIITPNRNESVVKRIAELTVDVDENLNEQFRFTLTEAGVFVTERYLDDNEMHDIKRRIQEIEQAL